MACGEGGGEADSCLSVAQLGEHDEDQVVRTPQIVHMPRMKVPIPAAQQRTRAQRGGDQDRRARACDAGRWSCAWETAPPGGVWGAAALACAGGAQGARAGPGAVQYARLAPCGAGLRAVEGVEIFTRERRRRARACAGV